MIGVPFDRWETKPFLVEPFEFGIQKQPEPLAIYTKNPQSHPIHRAIEWQAALDEQPWLTRTQIAEQQGVSRCRIKQILQLLLLPTDVVDFLRTLDDPREIRFFNEHKLRPIISAPTDHKGPLFEQLKQGWSARNG